MLEQGIVQLVQGTDTVSGIASHGGGFMDELPKGQVLPSWSWQSVSDNPNYGLQKEDQGLTMRRLQIDCFGDPNGRGADAIALARAINCVLSGYTGTLDDPDQTIVDSCFRSDLIDFFDPDSRSFRRMLEYEIWYIEPVDS